MTIKHVSASSITLFSEGCERRWYEQYINEHKSPQTAAMARGSNVHKQLEDYLLSGVLPDTTIAGQIAQAGIHLIPQSEEQHIEASLSEFPVAELPIAFKGFIDVYIPGEIPHIIDHKTTSAFKWAKTEDQLKENIQMIIYARHVLEHCDAPEIDLTHIYYLTKPPYASKKVSVRVSREDIYTKFQAFLTIVERMISASIDTIDATEKNTKNCYAYGRRCPHYDSCFHTLGTMEKIPMSEKQTQVIDILRKKKKTGKVTLYVGCRPLIGEVTPILDAIGPLMDEVCSTAGVGAIELISYGQGWPLLHKLLKERGLPPQSIYIDPRSHLYSRVGDVLISLSDDVVIAG